MLERIKSKRLTMSELLSIAANIYKQNIKTILFVSFFIIVPLFLFNQWILSQTDLESLYSKKLDMTAEMNILVSASLYNLVSSLVQMVLQPLASIAIVAGVVNIIQEQKSSAKSNFLYSFSKAPAAIWTTFLQAVFLFLIMFSFLILGSSCLSIPEIGMILFCVVVIFCLLFLAYFTTMWAFADEVVAIQGLSGMMALMASKRAVKNHFKETFLYLALCLILSFALGQGVEPMLNQISTTDATYFLSFAIWNFVHYVIINGFFIVFMTVLFLNRVWKKEEDKVEQKKIEEEEQNEWKQIKEEIQNKVDLEKMSNNKQNNKIDLEKTPDTIQQQQTSDDDKAQK